MSCSTAQRDSVFHLDDALAKIATWVADYNRRPHSSLNTSPPAAYAAHLTATDDRLRNPDQLRQSSVAPPAPLGVQNPETLTLAYFLQVKTDETA